tara:strand:- start:345 stop:632 length:288 start_codon:yes stop_codon:yes gene_type:complete
MNSINKLNNFKEKKEEIKKEVLNKIYDLCIKTIDLHINNKYACIYEIPYILFGYSKYDINECLKFLKKKLYSNGFKYTIILEPNKIYINWYCLVK